MTPGPISYVPGDEYVDPLIKRGEELERLQVSSARPTTDAEDAELDSIKAYARAKLAHLSQYPLASTAQEESAQYLAEQEARSAREREEAALRFAQQAWEVLKPVLLALAKDAIAAGVQRLDLPAPLAPLGTVVKTAAGQGVATVLDDLGVP